MVTIVVDNRVRISGLSQTEREALVQLFTHENPKAKMMRARKMKGWWNEPLLLPTWAESDGVLSVPRGGMARVRIALEERQVPFRVQDRRERGCPVIYPETEVELWPHQERIIGALMKRENCLVKSSTGCISGDAKVELNRGGKSFFTTMKHFVRMQNGGSASNRVWDPEIPTLIRSRDVGGHVRLYPVVSAWFSGVKFTFEVTTKGGRKIRATSDHRFFTETGWKRLGEIAVGENVLVDGGPPKKVEKKRKKKQYAIVGGLHVHPHAVRRNVEGANGGRVPLHRLVAESARNRLDYEEFVEKLKKGEIAGLRFIDPKLETVHHRDGDHRNNAWDNLEVVPRIEHYVHHGRTDGWKHVLASTVPDEIVSIVPFGHEETFDVEVGEGFFSSCESNFLANGFVVHNSGKTSALLAFASRANTTTLVVVHSTALMYQWVERAQAELGMAREDLGMLGDGKHRVEDLTIGTMKSVAKEAEDPAFRVKWGAVLADEVHLFAAQSFYACIDPFPARYRVGVSDDQRRKDRKEFLIHDLFGDVAEEVSHEEMIKAGHVMDVEVLVVPTEFDAPWYTGEDGDRSPDYMRLVGEMSIDPGRNDLVEGILRRELADNRQCLVFAREREHCRELGRRAAQYVRAGYLIGGAGADRQEFDRTRKGLKDGALRAAVGTLQACGTGVDLPGVEVGIAAVPILSNRQMFRQARGRICRKPAGKTVARFYVLFDHKVFGMRHVENAASWNATTFVWEKNEWVPVKVWLKARRFTSGR